MTEIQGKLVLARVSPRFELLGVNCISIEKINRYKTDTFQVQGRGFWCVHHRVLESRFSPVFVATRTEMRIGPAETQIIFHLYTSQSSNEFLEVLFVAI